MRLRPNSCLVFIRSLLRSALIFCQSKYVPNQIQIWRATCCVQMSQVLFTKSSGKLTCLTMSHCPNQASNPTGFSIISLVRLFKISTQGTGSFSQLLKCSQTRCALFLYKAQFCYLLFLQKVCVNSRSSLSVYIKFTINYYFQN